MQPEQQQQTQQYPPAPQPVHPPQPADDGTVMGALALAMSVCFPPVGIVLGIIALKKSRPGTPGHILGLIGLLCSVLFIVLFFAYLAFLIVTGDYEESEDTQSDYSSAQEL